MTTEEDMHRVFNDTHSAENPKDRIGSTKPPLHLIPPAAEVMESLVMALGAAKYGELNWRRSPVRASVYVAAARRHLLQWFDGQDDDPESGVSHLAHARASLGILLDAIATGNAIDDRPAAGASPELIERFTGQQRTTR
ncbi:dATP/dGTP diphosphohydrolase domain-containing protein [Maioricimonas sp. JC845]|uniref:dATP/dGTP diphosphohydrolase domain-containing protein n=1 Tax=Maioricimonas sp. JC845 TaxID=3232138 RepID=UPI0034575E8F